MGNIRSNIDSQQILLLGLEKSGKSLFLKKLLELKKAESEEINLESTIGYNYVNINYAGCTFDIWELGGDQTSRSYWSTFYRNLKVTIVIYFINIFDQNSHLLAMKELLALINEEELKTVKFFIIFNPVLEEIQKMSLTPAGFKELDERYEEMMSILRECPIHDYDSRVHSVIFDVSKMKEGENKTNDLLSKCLMGGKESKLKTSI